MSVNLRMLRRINQGEEVAAADGAVGGDRRGRFNHSVLDPQGACKGRVSKHCRTMTVEQIKSELTVLSAAEQNEVTAFLFHLRHRDDPDYRHAVGSRLNDRNKDHWLTPEDFELELEKR